MRHAKFSDVEVMPEPDVGLVAGPAPRPPTDDAPSGGRPLGAYEFAHPLRTPTRYVRREPRAGDPDDEFGPLDDYRNGDADDPDVHYGDPRAPSLWGVPASTPWGTPWPAPDDRYGYADRGPIRRRDQIG